MTELTPNETIQLHHTDRALFMMLMHNREQMQLIKGRLSNEAWDALVNESCKATRRKYPWLYKDQKDA